MRLAADVASLETALRLRHEELVTMEARAEGLERRILDGVIDHSRALLISRPYKDTSNMSLKRVPSQASSTLSTIPSSGLGMALRSRPPPIRVKAAEVPASGRRILSLNQITRNVPTGAHGASQGSKRAQESGGLDSLKRSHSVRTTTSLGLGTGKLRKSSWAASGRRSGMSSEADDKENETFAEESDEEEAGSETGTERRTSFTTTERRSSFGTMTNTERRTSYGTVTGTLGTESMIDEGEAEGEGDREGDGAEEGKMTSVGRGRLVVYDGPADSGMGDDLATADLHGEGVVWAG